MNENCTEMIEGDECAHSVHILMYLYTGKCLQVTFIKCVHQYVKLKE